MNDTKVAVSGIWTENTTTAQTLLGYVTLYARLALGIAFLSAVADRFGLWGLPGANGVAWGNFENFLTYTASLNPFLPDSLIPVVGWVVTIAETVLGVLLILGFRLREVGIASGLLLLAFAFGVTVGTGFKRALDLSVFAASAAGFLLAVHPQSLFSLDHLLKRRMKS
jgi:thiosulfate dehydrogenase (quinone) large subunit